MEDTNWDMFLIFIGGFLAVVGFFFLLKVGIVKVLSSPSDNDHAVEIREDIREGRDQAREADYFYDASLDRNRDRLRDMRKIQDSLSSPNISATQTQQLKDLRQKQKEQMRQMQQQLRDMNR